MMNLIIGIVGEICSGKSSICEFFKEKYGFTIVENDDEVIIINIG
jgi:dephospho-CoA kinase